MPRTLALLACLLVAAVPAAGQVVGVPDLWASTADMPAATGEAVLMVLPDGSGPAFAAARDALGSTVDATVVLTLLDGEYRQPIAYFPGIDVWLAPAGPAGTLAACSCDYVCHVFADGVSDLYGRMTWSDPPRAGGWTDGLMQVFVNGGALRSGPGLALRFNSPDLDGDLRVDLRDAGLLAADLRDGYRFRSDLAYDGVLNVSDAGAFAAALGHGCP